MTFVACAIQGYPSSPNGLRIGFVLGLSWVAGLQANYFFNRLTVRAKSAK